jgi:chemotaxis protein methyltransferase WspC
MPAVAGSAAAASGEDLLQTARRLADAGRHAEAIVLCDRHLRNSGPSAEAYFLLGMLHQAGDDLSQAEACLQKTLYLDACHEEAILALASLATRRGDETRADRYRETAQRVRGRRRSP